MLRPLVKPYTETLDSILESFQQFGDLALLLCAVPLHLVSSVYRRWILRERPVTAEETETPSDEQEASVSEFGQTRARKNILRNAHLKTATAYPSTPSHDVWHPPASAYEGSPPGRPVGLPTPPAEDQLFYTPSQNVDEWRQYEAFPSAYPATPPSRTSGLPPIYPSLRSSLDGLPNDTIDQPGFYQSLQLPRESPYPDSDGNLSDERHYYAGVQTDGEMSVDEDYEEDDFNVTLRTPYPLSRIMNVSGMTVTSEESQSNDSTGLSTIDYGSPLQTRTNSEASNNDYSDASSTAGKKRSLPAAIRNIPTTRPVMRERLDAQDTVRVKPSSTRPSVRLPLASRKQSKAGGRSDSGESGEEDVEVTKRQCVESKPIARKVPARPLLAAKQGENRAPPRKAIPRTSMRPAAKVAPKTVTNKATMRPPLSKEAAETTTS